MVTPTQEQYQKVVEKALEEHRNMVYAPNSGILPPITPPRQTSGLGAHQHSLDALQYAAIGAAAKQKTPKQLAMMGTYNQRSPDEDFYIKLLGMRLRVKDGEMIPFEYIGCHHDMASGDVHLMIVKDNEAVTFKESGAIFPSDQTIAKLNLIINK